MDYHELYETLWPGVAGFGRAAVTNALVLFSLGAAGFREKTRLSEYRAAEIPEGIRTEPIMAYKTRLEAEIAAENLKKRFMKGTA
jgi:hypothetical protein